MTTERTQDKKTALHAVRAKNIRNFNNCPDNKGLDGLNAENLIVYHLDKFNPDGWTTRPHKAPEESADYYLNGYRVEIGVSFDGMQSATAERFMDKYFSADVVCCFRRDGVWYVFNGCDLAEKIDIIEWTGDKKLWEKDADGNKIRVIKEWVQMNKIGVRKDAILKETLATIAKTATTNEKAAMLIRELAGM